MSIGSLDGLESILAIIGVMIGAPLLVRIWQFFGALIGAVRVYAQNQQQGEDEWAFQRVSQLELQSAVEEMARQFQVNGGSSLRDVIDRVERRLERIEQHLEIES